jgi:hypothetical protein
MAESGTNPKPVAQRHIKELHKHFAHIMAHPLVKYTGIKIRQPIGRDAPWHHLSATGHTASQRGNGQIQFKGLGSSIRQTFHSRDVLHMSVSEPF